MTRREINERFSIIFHEPCFNSSLPNFRESVLEGLSQPLGKKQLPCRFFYDSVGSELFEEITKLKEYYPTSCEQQLLQFEANYLANYCPPDTILIELGSGSSTKTRIILDAFIKRNGIAHYFPIEISQSILEESCYQLLQEYDSLQIVANNGLYQQGLEYISDHYSNRPKLILFLGGSIGNFTRNEAIQFLREISIILSPKDRVLIGIDIRKDKAIIEPAYNDSKGITAKFNLNLLERINRELGGKFDISLFEHVATYLEEEGLIQMELRSLEKQKIRIDSLQMEVEFEEGETIHTENSFKYSLVEIIKLASKSNFSIHNLWMNGYFSLCLFQLKNNLYYLKKELIDAWKTSDRIFGLLTAEGFFQQPINLRHPFIFYLGHLSAFANNHISNYLLKIPSLNQKFDEIFERGIDPSVDEPEKCHHHLIVPHQWPCVREVIAYQQKVRKHIQSILPSILDQSSSFMGHHGRVVSMVAEHEYMHAETLLYMYLDLEPKYKRILSEEEKNYILRSIHSPETKSIIIPEGKVILGKNFQSTQWGWDNEFPEYSIQVPSFEIDVLPVTNQQFLDFIESKEYENPKYWKQEDWIWKEKINQRHPHSWFKDPISNEWYVNTIFDRIEMKKVTNWPVYVSHAEAVAYASWKGKRLPSEAEFHRAAYGIPNSTQTQPFPWGNEKPIPGVHGNFGFYSWAPTPVGYFSRGKSAFGIYDLIGNGWEWTNTLFNGFPNFRPFIPQYPGYSKDFFDQSHYVMLGASWATDPTLIRKSFRNWFQSHYYYTFSKFRCVQSLS